MLLCMEDNSILEIVIYFDQAIRPEVQTHSLLGNTHFRRGSVPGYYGGGSFDVNLSDDLPRSWGNGLVMIKKQLFPN